MTEGAINLAQKARLAIAWTAGLNIARDAVQFGLMLVLVRLLPADVYGQFGLVNSIIGFMMVFSFREFVAHTLVVRKDDGVNYQHHFTAGLVIQSTLFVVANVVAVAVRWFPSYSAVAPLLHVMSIAFLLDLPSELRMKMLERALDWRRLRTIEGGAIAASALASIALAAAGAGAFALLLPALLYPAFLMVDLLFVEGWRPTFDWKREQYAESKAFGLVRVGSASSFGLSNLLESSALTHAVGFAGLGLFGRATSLSLLACHRAAFLLTSSIFPVLTRLEAGSVQYQRAAALVLRAVTWLVVPAAVGLAVLAAPLVQTLYGSHWIGAIPFVPWAMLVGGISAVVHVSYYLLLGNGRQRACLTVDAWKLAGVAIALAVALPFGVIAYMKALAVVHLIALVLVARALIASRGLHAGDFASALLPAGVAAASAALVLQAWRPEAVAGANALPWLVLWCLLFAAVYLAVLRAVFPRQLRDVLEQAPHADRLVRWTGLSRVHREAPQPSHRFPRRFPHRILKWPSRSFRF